MQVKSLEEYIKDRESGVLPQPFTDIQEVKDVKSQASKKAEENPEMSIAGKEMEFEKNEKEYKQMLNFLRGKKTEPAPVVPPKEAPKGWFVVDEQSRGFWANGSWQYDEGLLSTAVLDSEKAATELARVVGGIVIPAEEIL